MENLIIIVWLLLVVFMIHDFEEIIFFKSWIRKNKDLDEKLPKVLRRFLPDFNNLSTSAFTLAVAEEFILLSLIILVSVLLNNYVLWLAAFMGFFFHLFIHIGQGIVLKRYVFGLWTSFPALIYCVYVLNEIITNNIFQTSQIILWTVIGLGLMGVNLIFAHKLAEMFDKRQAHLAE